MPTNTLGTLRVEVLDWLDEVDSIPTSRANAAINDAIESLWETLMRANLSLFMGGPVSLTIDTNTQGVILVSIVDPTVAPTVSDSATASDPAAAAHTVDVAYTYVTESGTETMASPTASHTVAVGCLAAVHPPTIATGAIGWNLYARSAATGSLVKQNDVPLEFLTTQSQYYNEPDSGFLNDPALPKLPTENTTGDDICYIRHLEAQMPDEGWKAYDSADISSLLMRRAGRNLATSSEYQNFYWDLINQRQLEFRPQTALAWNPRYFYIKRPRRLLYDNSPLPFLTVPSVAFLRSFALSRLSLSVREFESAKGWNDVAETERGRCELAVVMMNHNRNDYITPFA